MEKAKVNTLLMEEKYGYRYTPIEVTFGIIAQGVGRIIPHGRLAKTTFEKYVCSCCELNKSKCKRRKMGTGIKFVVSGNVKKAVCLHKRVIHR